RSASSRPIRPRAPRASRWSARNRWTTPVASTWRSVRTTAPPLDGIPTAVRYDLRIRPRGCGRSPNRSPDSMIASPPLSTSDRRAFRLFLLFALIVLGIGIGLRDPWPSDEPRFTLAAQRQGGAGGWPVPPRGRGPAPGQ